MSCARPTASVRCARSCAASLHAYFLPVARSYAAIDARRPVDALRTTAVPIGTLRSASAYRTDAPPAENPKSPIRSPGLRQPPACNAATKNPEDPHPPPGLGAPPRLQRRDDRGQLARSANDDRLEHPHRDVGILPPLQRFETARLLAPAEQRQAEIDLYRRNVVKRQR